jgi:hypothetical protein
MLVGSSKRSYPRPDDDETKTNGVWLKGHTGKLTPFRAFTRPFITIYETLEVSRYFGANPYQLYKFSLPMASGDGLGISTMLL